MNEDPLKQMSAESIKHVESDKSTNKIETVEKLETPTDHIQILTEQLEQGTTSHFDTSTIELLKKIENDPDKSKITTSLVSAGIITLKSLGSKAVGVLGAIAAGTAGKNYTTHKAAEYLSQKFTIDPNTVSSLPSKATSSISEAAHSAVQQVNPSFTGGIKSIFSAAKETATGAVESAKQLITENGGAEILKTGSNILHTTKEAIVGGAEHVVNNTVEGINNLVINPAIKATSEATGWISYVPSAAIGYLLASGVTGGVMGVIKDKRDSTQFEHIQPLIKEMRSADKNHKWKLDEDPRLDLLTEFDRIKTHPEKYSYSKEEWLVLASATREAKCSILREKAAAPKIVLESEKEGLIKKRQLIESIILNTQSSLAAEDQQLTREILAQYDDQLSEDMSPMERHKISENKIGNKLLHYSKVFAESGIKATGLPTLWKAVKLPLRVVRKFLPI